VRASLPLTFPRRGKRRALLAGAGREVSTAISQGLQGTVDDALIEICRLRPLPRLESTAGLRDSLWNGGSGFGQRWSKPVGYARIHGI